MVIELKNLINKAIFYIIGYIVVIFASRIVGRIVRQYEIKDIESLPGAGSRIGILERILVITFVYLKAYQAIAIILAAKSIIRFEKERKFAEYFLIGTFCSLIIAIITGIIIIFLIDNVNIFIIFDP